MARDTANGKCWREKLIKEIEKLEKQARNEKQPNKKFELAQKAKALKKQLEEL